MKNEVRTLLQKYEGRLAEKGIVITFSQKYREEDVRERQSGGFLDTISKACDRKRENESYHYEKNRYHCIVLTVSPLDKSLLPLAYHRQYSFVVKKTERPHIGMEPIRKEYTEEKVLGKIERRIQKILRKAEKYPPNKVCRDTFWDAFRYMDRQSRGYKSKILGKSSDFWDMVLVAVTVGALALFLAICYMIF